MARLSPAAAVAAVAVAAAVALPAAADVQVAPGRLDVALDAAGTGAVLVLAPGEHPGPIRVERAVTLVGQPGAELVGPGTGTVLTVAAAEVTVRGLTIRGSGADLARDEAVVLVEAVRDVRVEDCRIEARAFGIYLQAGGGHRIAGNVVLGDPGLPMVRRGNGIHLWKTEHNEIVGNELVAVRDGVYLSFAHDNTIEANRGAELRYGIHYMYSERNTLRGNHFNASTGGIALMFSMRNVIEKNRTLGNRDFGILCQQIEHSHLASNVVAGNGRGFYVENSAGNRFVGNDLRGNGVGVYLTAGSERNVLLGNRFTGNLVQAFDDRPQGNVFFEDRRGNRWSDYAGFDWDGDGVGETPYRLRTAASALMARRPITRWFWMSPALALLDWWDALAAPVRDGNLDPFPLVGETAETG